MRIYSSRNKQFEPGHSRQAFCLEDRVNSAQMKRFRKTIYCPSSETLLAFQRGEADPARSMKIRRHFDACEFCATEVEFYALYPPLDEKPRPEKIPQPLFELAEALLQKNRDLRSLYELIASE